jgi:hypothetical protein
MIGELKQLHKKREIILYYMLCYLLLAFSGINLFIFNRRLLVAYFLFLLVLFIYYKRKVDRLFLIVVAFYVSISFLQYFSFNFFSFSSFASTIILLSIGYAIIKIMRQYFINIYINTIFFLSCLSLVFWLLSIASPPFFKYISTLPYVLGTDPYEFQNVLVYTVESTTVYGIFRNAGFVYEPGIFAVLLVIGLVFNTFYNNKFIDKKNIIFSICILSTFSTAGYLALFVYLIAYYLFIPKLKFRYFALPLIFLFSYISFNTFDFLGSKISNQVEDSGYYKGVYTNQGRIGSGLVDMESILKYPIAGRGRNERTRFDWKSSNLDNIKFIHRTNGVFDLIAEFGIPFSFLYLFLIYRSFNKTFIYNKAHKKYALAAFIMIMVLGFSQTFFMRPLIICLMFLGIAFNFRKIKIVGNDIRLHTGI